MKQGFRISTLQKALLSALAEGIDAAELAHARSAAALLAAVPANAAGLVKLDTYSELERASRYGWRDARAVTGAAYGIAETADPTASQIESARRSLHTLADRGLVELAAQPLDQGGRYLVARITPDGLRVGP
jgi:hypothetical protein